MEPHLTGKQYDKIASWWHDYHKTSSYGVKPFEHALSFVSAEGKEKQTAPLALDVGCGSSDRFISILERRGFLLTGIDVSEKMIKLAKANHPSLRFLHKDIGAWQPDNEYDYIYAWDSLFHLPLSMQKPVLTKLCNCLKEGGVLLYTFGGEEGEQTGTMQGNTFYYSSIGTNKNIQLLIENGLHIQHLEKDQYPEDHVYVIASKAQA